MEILIPLLTFSDCILRRILERIEQFDSQWSDEDKAKAQAQAYVYIFLMFGTQVIRVCFGSIPLTRDSLSAIQQILLDLQHLYFQRRAVTRIRSELMAAIYEKALKRKDYSGVPDSSDGQEGKAADVGKIVNLMSGDATTVRCVLLPSRS